MFGGGDDVAVGGLQKAVALAVVIRGGGLLAGRCQRGSGTSILLAAERFVFPRKRAARLGK